MKKRWIFTALALALVLSGCSSMLERVYVSSVRHVEYHSEGDASILQAESYQGMVSALLYFVTEHAETGVIHLSNYVGDVGKDLAAACAEVMEEDPIGAYALNGIEHTHTRIVSYYEVNLAFDYAHTAEEMDAIVPAGSSQALYQAVAESLAAFEERCVIRMSYFIGDEVSLLTAARQLWLDAPLAALARPEMRVKLYPDSGTSRVVEFTFNWPEEADDLAARRSATEAAARRLLEELSMAEGEELTAERLLTALRERVALDLELGGETAYDALVGGAADRRGMTLALRLLCGMSGLEATVVEGRLSGEAAYWLIVSTAEGYRHLDPAAETPFCAVDEDFQTLGHEWSAERYPACVGPPAITAETEPPEE